MCVLTERWGTLFEIHVYERMGGLLIFPVSQLLRFKYHSTES